MTYSNIDIISLLQRIDAGGSVSAEEYCVLKDRTTLDLRETPIYALPESIGLLSNLTYLNLSNTRLCNLPESIGRLTQLKTLILYHTSIMSLPESMRYLSNLQVLSLSSTPISSLPEFFNEMNKLEELDLSNTKVTFLPETISSLALLRRLDIDNTRIAILPEWLGALPSLDHLDLSGITVPNIPRALELKGLAFYCEPFFPGMIDGINLFRVTLTKQDINVFPLESYIIHCKPNNDDYRRLNECNVFLLGEYDTSNKSIIHRFINLYNRKPLKSDRLTDTASDVDVSDYHFSDYIHNIGTVHFWTIWNHFFLQSMHRFIAPLGACYVIVVSEFGVEGKKQAYHWLQIVRTIAPNSPVLLFINIQEDHEKRLCIYERDLERDFPNIKKVIFFSEDQVDGISFFRNFLAPVLDMACESTTYTKEVSSEMYLACQTVASEIRDSNHLSSEQYENICEEHSVNSYYAKKLLMILKDLGICVSNRFGDNTTDFSGYMLLDYKWLINGIYSILKEGNAFAIEGRIKQKAITQILCNKAPKTINGYSYRRIFSEKKYNKDDCNTILAVAEANGMCYRVDTKSWFFPECCEKDTPEDIAALLREHPNHIEYIMQYSFSPVSVIHRLIIRSLQMDLSLNSCWALGMILGWNATHKAIIRVEENYNLSICICTKANEPAYALFSLLRSELHEINKALNVAAKEYVLSGSDQYPINSLINAAKGTDTVYGNVTGEAHSAAKLLGCFYDEWSVKLMSVSDGVITIPILPIEYHRCDPQTVALRQALYEAYHEQCYYCGNHIRSLSEMQVEHVFPKNYKETGELEGYIKYLKQRGFNTEKPDYIENYLPVHGTCNLAKSNYVEPYVLLARHECAARKAPQILRLMNKYRRE